MENHNFLLWQQRPNSNNVLVILFSLKLKDYVASLHVPDSQSFVLTLFPPTESDPIKFPAMQSASQCEGILCSEWASFDKGEDSIDVEIRQLSDDYLICVVMMGTSRGFFVPENVDDCPKKNSSFDINEIEKFLKLTFRLTSSLPLFTSDP